MNSETKIYQIPKFTGEHIPVKEAARIMGKDSEYIRQGLIEGFLPIFSPRMVGSIDFIGFVCLYRRSRKRRQVLDRKQLNENL